MNRAYDKKPFKIRLHKALHRAGIEPHALSLSRLLNERFPERDSVSRFVTRRWLEEGVIPLHDRLLDLAKLLDVSSEWLMFGTTYQSDRTVYQIINSFKEHEEHELSFSAKEMRRVLTLAGMEGQLPKSAEPKPPSVKKLSPFAQALMPLMRK